MIGSKLPIKQRSAIGGILSPTLYIIYTSDIPPPGKNCIGVAFADDITQIIQNFNDNREKLAQGTAREIERVNKFEKKVENTDERNQI